jgi:hypothetical protein
MHMQSYDVVVFNVLDGSVLAAIPCGVHSEVRLLITPTEPLP